MTIPAADVDDPHRGQLWLTAKEAAEHVGCKSVSGWYQWKWRHGIVTRANGTVNRKDIDRALMPRRGAPKRGGGAARNPNSLANLTNRRKPFTPRGAKDAVRDTRALLNRFAKKLSRSEFIQACEQIAELAKATADAHRASTPPKDV